MRALPLPYTVIIKQWEPATAKDPVVYAQRLASTLIASGAFRASRFENTPQATEGNLIATSTGAYCNRAVIPLFTLFSLGIVPTIFDDEDCEGMEVRRAGGPANAPSVRIDFQHRGRVVMGWAAVVMGIMPGWSYGSARNDPRFYQRFRLEIIRHKAEIERIAPVML